MNDIQIFVNPEFGEIRTVEMNGEPWFVGKDVAAALGYTNPNEAIQDHVDKEDKLNSKMLSSFALELGQRGGWLINESGVYNLIFSSKLEGAVRFKRWVTSEVLPAIRKTGSYAARKPGSSLEALDLLVKSLHEQQDAMNRLELNVKAQNAEIGKLKEQNEMTREAFQMTTINWRDTANTVVRKIVWKRFGADCRPADYENCWTEIYARLDKRGLDMERRYNNLKKSCPKKNLKKIDVIQYATDSKRLIHELIAVLREMAVCYGVTLSQDTLAELATAQKVTAGKLIDYREEE